jgi:Ca-activated chloride channel family protein
MPNAGFFRPQPQQPQYQSKLDRVKSAAIKAIQQLSDDDRLGVVSFDSYVTTVVTSTLATPDAKAKAIASINALQPGSSTALHAGWKGAAEMVCQNLDPKMVNRVLLLTDGEATDGIKDVQTLSKHAGTMAEHGVTTSTFGVGDQYNETLLQGMAESGDGRYYYLEGDANFERLFAEEFQGMSRLYGSDVRLRVHAAAATLELYNDLPVTPQGWKLPNAVHEKVEYYLVTLKPSKVPSDSLDFIVAYDYKYEGVVKTVNLEHTLEVVKEKVFSSLKANDTVAKKQLELETARAKEKAMEALDRGDYLMSKSILTASASTISGSAYASAPEFMAQSARLETLMHVGDSGDHKKLRKMSSHDTYATRNNFNDPNAS